MTETSRHKLLVVLICCFAGKLPAFAQTLNYAPVIFKQERKGLFAFTKKWDYAWDVIKDEHGKFTRTDSDGIAPADTVHLFFTADCKTNVQGGYEIRYVYATKVGQNISLNFSDGSPAYASEFNVRVSNIKFSFTPRIIYPQIDRGKKISYKVTGSKLILYQKNSKVISGYVDAEFIENTSISKGSVVSHKYYFRG